MSMQNNNIYETNNEKPKEAQNDGYNTIENSYQEVVKNKKVILFFTMIGLGLLLIVIITYLFYSNKTADKQIEKEKQIATDAGDGIDAFFDMREILSTIDSNGRNKMLLKLDITFRIPKNSVNAIKTQEPVIRDIIITYVRSLRAEDIQGSFGLDRKSVV